MVSFADVAKRKSTFYSSKELFKPLMGRLSCTSREMLSQQKLRNQSSTPQVARVFHQQSCWVYLDLLFRCHSPYLFNQTFGILKVVGKLLLRCWCAHSLDSTLKYMHSVKKSLFRSSNKSSVKVSMQSGLC